MPPRSLLPLLALTVAGQDFAHNIRYRDLIPCCSKGLGPMKKFNARHSLLLFAVPILLLGFGSLWPSKPTLSLKSVHIRPGVNTSGKPTKGELAVDVLTEYSDPSIAGLFLEPQGLWFNVRHGLYVEDEHGVRYGKGYPPDTKTYRPFTYSQYGSKDTYGLIFKDINGNPYAWSFHIPIYKIPKSAGKLTLKTVLESGKSDLEGTRAQLPIAIVVRQ
jgi:hypothetical protein